MNDAVSGKSIKYKCPCCGCYTFPVPASVAVAYGCPVCYWENDVFINSDDEPSDENHGMTLNQARENYRSFGACDKSMLVYVRRPKADELSGTD